MLIRGHHKFGVYPLIDIILCQIIINENFHFCLRPMAIGIDEFGSVRLNRVSREGTTLSARFL